MFFHNIHRQGRRDHPPVSSSGVLLHFPSTGPLQHFRVFSGVKYADWLRRIFEIGVQRVDHDLGDDGEGPFFDPALGANIVKDILQDVSDAPLAVGDADIQGDLSGKLVFCEFLLHENLAHLRAVAVRDNYFAVALFDQRHNLFHAPPGHDKLLVLARVRPFGDVEGVAAKRDEHAGALVVCVGIHVENSYTTCKNIRSIGAHYN